ncbi:YggS family pyridoxal phosphate-dependent enzyme [Undibacterium sp. Jales W-56]|uniref:YggS family pyridoxal phosphate-dependent enzyme n=1 Tax=Undibacterium sp. Jales W-56 TaxID=2897325 RepID=UPI0021CFCBA8|nr:YggS family pyridoxal phosphate-dependent enzyme [Undibacterium sp. Jales W-56]MCU6432409.1 YggS family pyridoxal phosphate-dependent enzyme [Undibacterium sp. Jales W-56]
MSLISSNLQAVRADLGAAALACGRDPRQIQLLAVSKTFEAQAVIEAAATGQQAFGENYLQEALEKMQLVHMLAPDLLLEWHFIGPIQSNKTRQIAENFDWVHSVDRDKIANRLSEQRPAGKPALNICLQVNISGETSKSGVMPDDAFALAMQIAQLPGLRLRGLMAVPEASDDEAQQRLPFRQLRELQEQLQTGLRPLGVVLDTLSMGMSADMHAAIAEGSTMVRIGSAIFGKRAYAK